MIFIKMCSSAWYISVLTLLLFDVSIGALQQQDGYFRECHVCVPVNNTTCEQSTEWSSVICPADSPFCATIAIAPNFRSSLTCTEALKSQCSLTYSSQNKLILNCVCKEHLCNMPFSRKLQNELLNLLTKNITSINLTESLFRMFPNVTNANKNINVNLTEMNKIASKNYFQITKPSSNIVIKTDSVSFTKQPDLHPRAEALKQEPSAPSDDDEDETEGSGSYEEIRSHSQPASPPAAPSSFLPANENNAPKLFYNFYITYLILLFVI